MRMGKWGSLVAVVAVAALTFTAAPAASAGQAAHGVSKSTVKWSLQHNAVVYAVSYANARTQGATVAEAKSDAEQAMFAGVILPKYTAGGVTRSYQAGISDISGDLSKVYIAVSPGWSGGKQDRGFWYCLSVDLTMLNDGYAPRAVSKPRLGQTTTVNSGCRPVS